MKRVFSLLLAFTCLLSVCAVVPYTAAADVISTTSSDGIKAENDTNWSYVTISGSTETPMVYSAGSSGMVIENPAANDQYAKFTTVGNGNSHPANTCDTALVYTAPSAGTVNINLRASVHNAGGDGVKVSAYLNSTETMLLSPTVVTKADGMKNLPAESISVQAGDKIYFVLNKNNTLSTDGGTFVATVELTPGTAPEPAADIISTTSSDGIKADNDTNWSYVYINSGTAQETAMVYGLYSGYPGMIIPNPASNDQYARFLANGGSHPANSGDVAAVYTVSEAGELDLAVTAHVNNAASDGVNVKIWINDKSEYLLIPTRVRSMDGTVVYRVPAVTVSVGDKIYFGLDKYSGLSNDAGSFTASVKTASAYPTLETAYTSDSLSNRVDYGYTYLYISEDLEESPLTYAAASASYMNGYAGKAYITEHDATGYYNDKCIAGAASSGYLARVYTAPVDGTITVDYSAASSNPAAYKGDGFGIALALNDASSGGLTEWEYMTKEEATASTVKSIQQTVNVQAGDRVYFLFSKNGGAEGEFSPSYDSAILHSAVTYTSLAAVSVDNHSVGNIEIIPKPGLKAGSVHVMSDSFSPDADVPFSYQAVSVPENIITDMLYEASSHSYRKSLDTTSVDYWGYFNAKNAGAASLGDTLVVYTMPCKARIKLAVTTQVLREKSDGVMVSIARNSLTEILHEAQLIEYGTEAIVIEKELVANAGDTLYVRLNKNATNSYDTLQFGVTVTYMELDPAESATQGKIVHPLEGTTTNVRGALMNQENSVWSYKKLTLSSGAITDMTHEYDEGTGVHSYRCSTDKKDVDYWGYVGSNGSMGCADTYDVLVAFTAPEKVKINAIWDIQVAREKSDGVVCSVFRNTVNNTIGKRLIAQYEAGAQVLQNNNIVLDKGDTLYFRLNKRSSNSYDTLLSNITIQYVEVNPQEKATEGGGPLVIEQGAVVEYQLDATAKWGENGFYYYASDIDGDKYYKLAYNSALDCFTFPENTFSDEWVRISTSGSVRTGNSYDPVLIYQIQKNAKVTISITGKTPAVNGDGVRLKVYRNGQKIAPVGSRWAPVSQTRNFAYAQQICVAEGEYIMLRINRNHLNSYDNLQLSFTVTYDEIYDSPPSGSVPGVKLPGLSPYVGEAGASALSDPTHLNRTPFSGVVAGLDGKSASSDPLSANIPDNWKENAEQPVWVWVVAAIGVAGVLGCGAWLILKKKKKQQTV